MSRHVDPLLRSAAAHALVDDVAVPVLDDATTHHVFRVLRVRDGDVVTVTDGAGNWRVCRARSQVIEPVADVAHQPMRTSPLTVAVAIPKQDRPEWIVQKLTEIGIDSIVLLHADRSVVRWSDDRAEKHLVKLRRIAVEAAMQSRRVRLPTIEGPLPAAAVLVDAVAAEPGGRDLDANDHRVAIGPEGGWSSEELAIARDFASIGETILRVETAALVAASRVVALTGAVSK